MDSSWSRMAHTHFPPVKRKKKHEIIKKKNVWADEREIEVMFLSLAKLTKTQWIRIKPQRLNDPAEFYCFILQNWSIATCWFFFLHTCGSETFHLVSVISFAPALLPFLVKKQCERHDACVFSVPEQIVSQRKLSKALLKHSNTVGKSTIMVRSPSSRFTVMLTFGTSGSRAGTFSFYWLTGDAGSTGGGAWMTLDGWLISSSIFSLMLRLAK